MACPATAGLSPEAGPSSAAGSRLAAGSSLADGSTLAAVGTSHAGMSLEAGPSSAADSKLAAGFHVQLVAVPLPSQAPGLQLGRMLALTPASRVPKYTRAQIWRAGHALS